MNGRLATFKSCLHAASSSSTPSIQALMGACPGSTMRWGLLMVYSIVPRVHAQVAPHSYAVASSRKNAISSPRSWQRSRQPSAVVGTSSQLGAEARRHESGIIASAVATTSPATLRARDFTQATLEEAALAVV